MFCCNCQFCPMCFMVLNIFRVCKPSVSNEMTLHTRAHLYTCNIYRPFLPYIFNRTIEHNSDLLYFLIAENNIL